MAKENSSHAPGSEARYEGERQRHRMGEGKGPVRGGNFDVSEYPGRARIAGNTSIMGTTLPDRDRGVEPTHHVGAHAMGAQPHPDHGPHHHSHAIHGHRR